MGATRARQGRWGRHVFWVLLFGTLLSALAMFAAWTWKVGDEGGPIGAGTERVQGQSFDTAAPPTPASQNP
jgi:hypothetical protein